MQLCLNCANYAFNQIIDLGEEPTPIKANLMIPVHLRNAKIFNK